MITINHPAPTTTSRQASAAGLDDVVAAHTVLSMVDGERGELVIRGAALDALAGHASFEQQLLRLFEGFFDGLPAQASGLAEQLGRARAEVFALLPLADPALTRLPPVEAMRLLVAQVADGHGLGAALQLAVAPGVALAAVTRLRQGLPALAPEPSAAHAQDLLRMAGLPSTPAHAAALDAYLVTVCDHGLNASTFTARVVASTQAGLTSCVVAALGALMGPLHGGAPGPVLDMLDAIGSAANAEPWLDSAMARGERLMGFGHRIYRVRDPRADVLRAALQRLRASAPAPAGAQPAQLERQHLAEAVERAALAVLQRRKPGRPLQTNVEYYTALLLDALGFEREAFTGVFACGRVLGWLAHAREQASSGRLIRPQSVYVGPAWLGVESPGLAA